jgi:hypothetical protein
MSSTDIISTIVTKLRIYDRNQIEEFINESGNPNTFTFESLKEKKVTTLPIWSLLYDNKFYAFASKNSNKVKAIEDGNNKIVLLIINTKYFPHPEDGFIPYLGIKAEAYIKTFYDNNMIPKIHQLLLKKYDSNLSFDWIKKLYMKQDSEPEKAWLIEITPKSFYSY